MAITNTQAALLPDQRLRPRAEQLRALYGLLLDDVSTYVGDLATYFAPADGTASPWADGRTDVPHNVTAADVAAFLTLEAGMLAAFSPQTLALVAKFCVRPVETQ